MGAQIAMPPIEALDIERTKSSASLGDPSVKRIFCWKLIQGLDVDEF